MKTVIITRSKWGSGALERTDNGKRCCLGFCAISYGVKSSKCEGIAMPYGLSLDDRKKLPKWLKAKDDDPNTDVSVAVVINDDKCRNWKEKEEELKPLFLKHKIRLVFRGKR